MRQEPPLSQEPSRYEYLLGIGWTSVPCDNYGSLDKNRSGYFCFRSHQDGCLGAVASPKPSPTLAGSTCWSGFPRSRPACLPALGSFSSTRLHSRPCGVYLPSRCRSRRLEQRGAYQSPLSSVGRSTRSPKFLRRAPWPSGPLPFRRRRKSDLPGWASWGAAQLTILAYHSDSRT